MAAMIRCLTWALLAAAPALLSLAPRPAHAFCIDCDAVTVIEYVNEVNGRYLLLPVGDPEVGIVERGAAGPGWQRTGNDFTTVTWAPLPVCRFYSRVFNAHFYTADPAECESVKRDPAWIYEKSPFGALPPVNGSCPGNVPVYRVYRDGDHRYTADPALRAIMLDKGWRDEGIAFCVRSGGREPIDTVRALPTRIDAASACERVAGSCVALDSLGAMPNRVPPYLPPNYITINPAYPPQADAWTGGWGVGDLHTSQPAIPSQILAHSFASASGALYIVGHDRAGGDYARIAPMGALPGVAGSHGDERMFVWRAASDRELRVSASVSVGVVAREAPGSQAYGHPVLQFGDAASGHSFVVTLQAFGTIPPRDFVGADARTGEPIVSTVFRADPLFGRALSGSFIPCAGDGSACAPRQANVAQVPFVFAIRRADFAAALRFARTVDPALSADTADYILARIALRNETYLDARLGATVTALAAELWYVE
jgi:hypothetical protein